MYRRTVICGVYAIMNTQTGEMYIGSSKDIVSRLIHHMGWMRRGVGRAKIKAAVEQYGFDSFTCLVLEECPEEDLFERESSWLQSQLPEYNSVYEASSHNRGVTWPDEVRSRISRSMKGTSNGHGRLGYKDSDETKRNKSEAQKRRYEKVGALRTL